MTNDSTPAPGWYPAPHANNEQRYWDGTQWLEPGAGDTAVLTEATPEAEAKPKKKGLRWWAWVLIGLGALILLIIIIGSLNRPAADDAAPVATSSAAPAVEEEEEVAEPVVVDVPDVTGQTVAEATSALEAAGLTVSTSASDEATVTGTSPAAGESAEEGSIVTIEGEEPPQLSMSQQNAVGTAEQYLRYQAFSREGLIGQLEYEGYSNEDATFAVDYIEVDWNEQAALTAEQYLEYQSFSRQGLIDQLIYEGFSAEQAEYGVTAVGY